ncbi:MAG: PEP-CTERM sorting domain-containing protein [gamma proteobacterium endosymbiont of Lamellibrachia anaximandri]|nr:PEP-CTERM sorting domain-containing protein [gamma proteobacterium endosymbiont of Lamellibrachia anaximandri]MBL3616252.1 PEP-CTERM sorting domain-containing protein [gamma proteobacterium endosymbiont of Lamellibrachia anaximandri]
MNTIKSTLIAVAVVSSGFSSLAQAAPVDLSSWSEEGPGGGVWSVAGDNNSVTQTVNSSTPTFFISDNPFIDSQFNGSLTVGTSSDDDFIGFVFGYQTPFSADGDGNRDMDFILFDWKQHAQSGGADEGFHLVQVDGDFSNNNLNHGSAGSAFWDHDSADADAGEFNILASSVGSGRGWLDYTTYDFTLTYESDLIEIVLDGGQFTDETIFSVAGAFEAGSFGFYNYSQSGVTYAGVAAESVPEPSALTLMAIGLLGVGGRRLLKR